MLFSLNLQLVLRPNLELQSDHFVYVEIPLAKEFVKTIQSWEEAKPALRVLIYVIFHSEFSCCPAKNLVKSQRFLVYTLKKSLVYSVIRYCIFINKRF